MDRGDPSDARVYNMRVQTLGDQDFSILTVATYNIHAGVGTDRRRDIERTARVIRQLDADILALQEVDSRSGSHSSSEQMIYLAESGRYRAIPGPTLKRFDGYFGNALLVRCAVIDVRTPDLSIPGREPRGVIDADLEVGGNALRVVATHLGLRARERRLQLARLISMLEMHAAQPTLLLGDLNEWRPLAQSLRNFCSLFGCCTRGRTFPAPRPLFALDRICFRPATLCASTEVYASPLARVASDHLPVKAYIRMT